MSLEVSSIGSSPQINPELHPEQAPINNQNAPRKFDRGPEIAFLVKISVACFIY